MSGKSTKQLNEDVIDANRANVQCDREQLQNTYKYICFLTLILVSQRVEQFFPLIHASRIFISRY